MIPRLNRRLKGRGRWRADDDYGLQALNHRLRLLHIGTRFTQIGAGDRNGEL